MSSTRLGLGTGLDLHGWCRSTGRWMSGSALVNKPQLSVRARKGFCSCDSFVLGHILRAMSLGNLQCCARSQPHTTWAARMHLSRAQRLNAFLFLESRTVGGLLPSTVICYSKQHRHWWAMLVRLFYCWNYLKRSKGMATSVMWCISEVMRSSSASAYSYCCWLRAFQPSPQPCVRCLASTHAPASESTGCSVPVHCTCCQGDHPGIA